MKTRRENLHGAAAFLGLAMVAVGILRLVVAVEGSESSCAGSLVPRDPPPGYTLVCAGFCEENDYNPPPTCPPQDGNAAGFGDYTYCPLCVDGNWGTECNCCQVVAQKDSPYGKAKFGVCKGQTGGGGCLTEGSCKWDPQDPLIALCSGLSPKPRD